MLLRIGCTTTETYDLTQPEEFELSINQVRFHVMVVVTDLFLYLTGGNTGNVIILGIQVNHHRQQLIIFSQHMLLLAQMFLDVWTQQIILSHSQIY